MFYMHTMSKEGLLALSYDRLEELLYAPRYYDPETFETFVVDKNVRYNLGEITDAQVEAKFWQFGPEREVK